MTEKKVSEEKKAANMSAAKYSRKPLLHSWFFILHCCIVLDYNHLGSEEVAFYKLF